MSDDTGNKNNIHGDVEKLVKIGTVQGNVFIISDKAIKDTLGGTWNAPSSRHPYPTEDVTQYLKVLIKSNRFGRKIQVRVPQDMTVSAFISFTVDILRLPWSKSLDELMISLRFSYAVVYQGKKIPLNKTLISAGIKDGTEVELFITAVCTDEIERAEKEEAKMNVMYEMGSRFRELAKRRAIRESRGPITSSKIKSWADDLFTHIDELGK